MGIEKMTMPQLGESVTEGTIEKWLVSPGDHVNKYDPIAEVNTDKVNAEVPSSFTGVMKDLIAQEGDTLEVGEVICTIEVEGGGSEEAPTTQEKNDEAENNSNAASSSTATKPKQDKKESSGSKVRYSPAVLRLSQEHDIDLTAVSGSGK